MALEYLTIHSHPQCKKIRQQNTELRFKPDALKSVLQKWNDSCRSKVHVKNFFYKIKFNPFDFNLV